MQKGKKMMIKTKCLVNFLHNSNVLPNPIITGNNVIEQVKRYKILGVILSNYLKWNSVM